MRPRRWESWIMRNVPIRWVRNWAWIRWSKRARPDDKLRAYGDYVEDATGIRPGYMRGPHGLRKVPKGKP